jgi:hypothetical protein
MTYEIDPAGRLRPPVTQHLRNDLRALAGEPLGRFVYAARGGWTIYGNAEEGSDGAIVTYAADARDGMLTEISEATVQPRPSPPPSPYPPSDFVGGYGWFWLRGGAKRVHGLWYGRFVAQPGLPTHTSYTYESIPVASDGQLGPVSAQAFEVDRDPGEVLVDVRSDTLYKAADQLSARGGLEAYVIESDGMLNQMGRTNLCLASTIGQYEFTSPLVTARGFLFASWNLPSPQQPGSYTPPIPTVCVYQGLRLKPLSALELKVSDAEAFIPSSDAEPALMAMGISVPSGNATTQELRLFSMNADGDLQQLAREELPDGIKQFLFHPSGRFLYAFDTASRLRAYSIDPTGRLELLMSIDHAGGSMAITFSGAQAENR